MKNVLIIQGLSTCLDMIEDLRKRGITPIMFMQTSDTTKELRELQKKWLAKVPKSIKVLYEQDTYEKTLKMLKKENIGYIVYTSEMCINIASKLSTGLKTPGLNYKYVDNYLYKSSMQDALKKYGIRHIRGELVTTKAQALKAFKKFGEKPVVLKPVRGAGTVSIKFCHTAKEVADGADAILSEPNYFSEDNIAEFVVQELITGVEYVVNSCVINGKTHIATLVKYNMVDVEGRPLYDNTEFVDPDELCDLGLTDLIDYTFDVNKALHFDNSFVHAEYFMDEKGPVLIEVNCRTMGGPFSSKLLSETMRFSETEHTVNGRLFPESINHIGDRQYHCYYKTILSAITSPCESKVISTPVVPILKRFKTYKDHMLLYKNNKLMKKIDWETEAGRVYFHSLDKQRVINEEKFFRIINNRYFLMLFEIEKEPDTRLKKYKDISAKKYIDDVKSIGTVLYLNDTNDKIPFVTSTSLAKIEKEADRYQFGVINFKHKPKYNREQLVKKIFAFLDKMATGAEIFIPNESYQIFPYGMTGFEILLKLAGYKILLPKHNYRGLFAQKVE